MAIAASDGMAISSELSIDNKLEPGCACDCYLLSRTGYYNRSEAIFHWKKREKHG